VPLAFIRPRNPTTVRNVPTGDVWQHKPKLDGYRLQAIKEGRPVRLFSRRGNEWTRRLPGLCEVLLAIPCRSAILDAELCLLGAVGVPDFYGRSSAMRRGGDLAVYAFDLLHRDGRDLRPLPLLGWIGVAITGSDTASAACSVFRPSSLARTLS
jgi:bifunctional non-homologous end joining protein LigD